MIDELMEKLLEEPVADDNEIVFTSRAVELIHQISEKCKDIPIVKRTQEQAENYAKDLTAEQVYYDMLCKIVGHCLIYQLCIFITGGDHFLYFSCIIGS